MGQKINPISLRTGIVKPWTSRWFFASKGRAGDLGKDAFVKFLKEDEAIRKVIRERIALAGIAGIEIERTSNHLRIFIKAARPGFVIGQGGKGIEELTKAIEGTLRKVRGADVKSAKGVSQTAAGRRRGSPPARPEDAIVRDVRGKNPQNVSVNVEELKRSEISAAHVAQQIAWDMEKRFPFRRTIKKYLDHISQNKEAKGAKIEVAGRLDGAEISRNETVKWGPLPLQTLRADIDYGTATAFTTFGTVGVKVWIYRGEVFEKTTKEEQEQEHERAERSRSRR